MAAATSRSSSSLGGGGLQAGEGPGLQRWAERGAGEGPPTPDASGQRAQAHPHWPGEGAADTAGLRCQPQAGAPWAAREPSAPGSTDASVLSDTGGGTRPERVFASTAFHSSTARSPQVTQAPVTHPDLCYWGLWLQLEKRAGHVRLLRTLSRPTARYRTPDTGRPKSPNPSARSQPSRRPLPPPWGRRQENVSGTQILPPLVPPASSAALLGSTTTGPARTALAVVPVHLLVVLAPDDPCGRHTACHGPGPDRGRCSRTPEDGLRHLQGLCQPQGLLTPPHCPTPAPGGADRRHQEPTAAKRSLWSQCAQTLRAR